MALVVAGRLNKRISTVEIGRSPLKAHRGQVVQDEGGVSARVGDYGRDWLPTATHTWVATDTMTQIDLRLRGCSNPGSSLAEGGIR